MAVVIDSGVIDAEDLLRHVPRDKWRELMLARRRFCEVRLSYDCRCLVEFVADAEVMYSALGYQSAEAMIREGYRLEPEEINVAVEWLKLNPPEDPLSLDQAVKLGARGRPKKGEEKLDNIKLKHQGGTGRAYILARLDRDGHTELAGKVRNKQLSANAAAEQVGYRKKPTPLEIILKQLEKLSESDRRYLLDCLLADEAEAAE